MRPNRDINTLQVPGRAAGDCTGYKILKRYQSKEQVLDLLAGETVLPSEEIKYSKGDGRRLAMELRDRVGGLTGEEIGSLFGIGASAVSQERKRLVSRISEDETLKKRFEDLLSRCSG